MNDKYTSKLITVFMVLVILLFLSVWRDEDHTVKTEFVKVDTVKDSLNSWELVPVSEEIPVVPDLPAKQIQYRDTGSIHTVIETRYIHQTVDTAAIIAEYIAKRKYELNVFDNIEQGKLIVYPVVQYNRLTSFSYEYTPVRRQVTHVKKNIWQPFISTSYSSANHFGLGAGFFYNNIGVEYMNINNANLIGIKYKLL